MTVRDIRIDESTRDLVVAAGDLQLVEDVAAIRQDVDQALGAFKGEWFLDLDEGVPYFDVVLVKNPKAELLRSAYRDRILARRGVKSLLAFEITYAPDTRTLSVEWTADTDLSELPVTGSTETQL